LLAALLCGLAPAGAKESEENGQTQGSFKLTYYWIAFEQAFEGRPEVPLYDLKQKVIAVVSDTFAEKVSAEGTGVLRDGRVVNLHKECRFAKYGWCFMLVNKDTAPFGFGSHAPLHPFRTLAVPTEVIQRGSVVYIPEFDGMPLPGAEGGFDFHDGCFVVEDTGWSLRGKHIDLFALSEEYYRILDEHMESITKVRIFTGSPLCPSRSETLYHPEDWARELLSDQ
jgi:3D (Asp-Asp-Asp) domain-containing protein